MKKKTIANVYMNEKPDRCTVCPLMLASMDGPYCQATNKAVYPEGRNAVHPSCPYKMEVDVYE